MVFCRIDITLSYRLIDHSVIFYFISLVIFIVSHNLFIMLTYIIISYFTKVRKKCSISMGISCFCSAAYGQNIDLLSAIINTNEAVKYQKVEWTIQITSLPIVNPYDYDEINIKTTLVSPSGKEKEIDGFYAGF